MFDYAAAGQPILEDFGKDFNPIIAYGAAILTDDNSAEAIADGIIRIKKMSPEERSLLGKNARRCAEDYDYKKLTKRIESIIE